MRSRTEFDRAGANQEFLKDPTHLPTLQSPWEVPRKGRSYSRPTAGLATVRTVAVERREAPLRMMYFSRSSAIRICAPLSLPVDPNLALPTGAEISLANQ